MAKIKHNNFLDTVDGVFTDATKAGVLHLYAEGDSFGGRKIRIDGKDLLHFGTTGYLGLEQDSRLKHAAACAIFNFGTQFPLSRTYISHPLYRELEEKIRRMYGYPVVITKNSTLGHIGVIPTAVRDEDGVILDHQVHWSVQNATQLLKVRGVPVEMIRHNNLDMLEKKIRDLSSKCRRIWFMADGVYSMYGDCSPIAGLRELCNKYPQLHLYFDDVHGMSWIGKNGTGYVLHMLKELPENTLLFGTLSKTFGASGAVLVCPDVKMYRKIRNFGGPLTFSAQLEPASVAAAVASADIHLSPEIYSLQAELLHKISYFNGLLEKTELPLVERNDCPVFYIGTGMPVTGYKLVRRLMREGLFVNLGIYPGAPVKNTGIRITISRHNEEEDMKHLADALIYHYPKALEETHTSLNRVRRAFRMPLNEAGENPDGTGRGVALDMQMETTVAGVNKKEWNALFAGKGVYDWDGLMFLEKAFCGNMKPEHNWSFYYFMIRDKNGKPVLATFFTLALWKEDMLAPTSVSVKLEEKRKQEPYHLTSRVLSMGSLFTEGQHCYLDTTHPQWREAVRQLLEKLETVDQKKDTSMLVLRDFVDGEQLNRVFHNLGFIKMAMPDSCVVEDLSWKGTEAYVASLSSRSRKHFRKEVAPYEKFFEVDFRKTATTNEIAVYMRLFENVRNNNYGLNMFSFPEKLFKTMSGHPSWEFMVLSLKKKYNKQKDGVPLGVMFCYRNGRHTYVPAFIGMNYKYAREYQLYRQMLYQTVKRAGNLGFQRIDFGLTAAFEKRKIGAKVIPKVAYIQAKDNFSMELMGAMREK
ncbi:bifunctional aminotransferase class I/II-fold pyridoxal phosphate-dependent enzyme/GNAT family N-acetyltransferase [Sinomicrobium kalidii]|uniref:bifunctional aminotransferase class I/II-fold pyridoxal phosphate-dependent enzyme/GNAT family N-acetyltransferase n=1 Tax=Sinomicrobium kalidii TaxID=2900738 RepID=UPI001E4615E7|nr:bifunctional aminotransferase class I/II-fold pyridoxal phosphate-dependent enzyme/GNAT family N-acetyltransferase [Sinomicrobium kalidii]UGU17338.1 bifunctional aminotransferase class I/II-fold pyridoxal phosphate-dependent enzyme/GNAT family N-acetyltransferase [Sinomicrobium kalidii]